MHIPAQRWGNISLCAAISLRGLLHHHAKLGHYNAQHIITFLDALHDTVVQDRTEKPRFLVVWDNVSFHRAALVQNWFTNHDIEVRGYFPRCLTREDIACDVDEILWPDPNRRQDPSFCQQGDIFTTDC